jgi:hypothetical protein
MKCYTCGNQFVEHTGSLELPSKILGDFTINNVLYFKCAQCEEIILPDETWRRADQEESRQIEKLLSDLPVKNFIGASKAATILEMSRQALHKHRRIRRGFIYSILHEGKILYHAESVKLFKETGDGRFPLKREVTKKEKEYVVVTIPYYSEGNRFQDYGGREKITGWNPTKNTLPTLTGHVYG